MVPLTATALGSARFASLKRLSGRRRLTRGRVPEHWTPAAKVYEMPDWQVHEYNGTSTLFARVRVTSTMRNRFSITVSGKGRATTLEHEGSRDFPAACFMKVERRHGNETGRISVNRAPDVVHSHRTPIHVWGDEQLRLKPPSIQIRVVSATDLRQQKHSKVHI